MQGLCCGTKAGSYLRLIDSGITQLKAQGPSRTCNESKGEEEEEAWTVPSREQRWWCRVCGCRVFLAGTDFCVQRTVGACGHVWGRDAVREGAPHSVSFRNTLFPTPRILRERGHSGLEHCAALRPQLHAEARARGATAAPSALAAAASAPANPLWLSICRIALPSFPPCAAANERAPAVRRRATTAGVLHSIVATALMKKVPGGDRHNPR